MSLTTAFQASLFRTPAAPKMGIVITGSNIGTLTFPSTPLTFGTTWRFKLRIRRHVDSLGQTNYYIAQGPASNWLFVFGFAGATYELFFGGDMNSSGTNKRVPTTVVNDLVYHTLEYTYANGVFSCFMDDVFCSSVSGAFTANSQASFQLGTGTFAGAIDYIFFESNGIKQMELNFLEPSGATFANTGTLGGSLNMVRVPGRELVN
ncbi:MAG TPA: hypothetical protein VF690_12975 [Hymenobacter sp.]